MSFTSRRSSIQTTDLRSSSLYDTRRPPRISVLRPLNLETLGAVTSRGRGPELWKVPARQCSKMSADATIHECAARRKLTNRCCILQGQRQVPQTPLRASVPRLFQVGDDDNNLGLCPAVSHLHLAHQTFLVSHRDFDCPSMREAVPVNIWLM